MDAPTLALLPRVLDAIAHAVMVLAPDGRIVWVNPAMVEYVSLHKGRRYTREELLALSIADLHPDEARPGQAARMDAVLASGDRLPPKPTRVGDVWFLTHYTCLRDDAGAPVAVVVEKNPACFVPGPIP
jgi:PAS domain-containing protein